MKIATSIFTLIKIKIITRHVNPPLKHYTFTLYYVITENFITQQHVILYNIRWKQIRSTPRQNGADLWHLSKSAVKIIISPKRRWGRNPKTEGVAPDPLFAARTTRTTPEGRLFGGKKGGDAIFEARPKRDFSRPYTQRVRALKASAILITESTKSVVDLSLFQWRPFSSAECHKISVESVDFRMGLWM